MIQGFNATLLTIQQNIPNTTSLLNDAIKNQRVAQAQVNSIIAQNTSITNNISGIESGIKTLQNQMLTTTNTLNNSNAQIQSLQTKITQNYIQIN
jgi:peptidoglycan hydrolase CwlO-like protein